MKISYDKEVDALYIRLLEGEHQARTLRLTEDVALNIGSEEQLIGVEILDAKKILGKGELPKLLIENINFAVAP